MKLHPFRVMLVMVLVITAGCLRAQDAAEVGVLLKQLQAGVGAEKQLDILDALDTSLDPRIPAACLPLLQSTGESVQRNAARAIGSRWWQIPPDQLAAYVEALKKTLGTADEQTGNMTRRGIGLLTRKYADPMFSRSRSKRWVVYERRGKPCIIDTQNHTEELLGVDIDVKFLPAYLNRPLTDYCHWHPKQDLVALDVLVFRRPRLLWAWQPGGGLRVFTLEEIARLLQPAKAGHSIQWIESLLFKEWKGTALKFTASYVLKKADDTEEHSAVFVWESATNTLRVQSDILTE